MIVYGGLVHKNSNSYNNGQDEDKENGSLSILVNTDDIKRAIDVERNDTVVSNEIYIYDTGESR